jgi:hypothetical protein
MKRKLKKYTYVYIANTDKDCDLLHDRPVLFSGRKSHTKKKKKKKKKKQPNSGRESQRGSITKQTDRPSVAK